MTDTPTIDILQNLKGVLYKIMGDSSTSKKYTNALEVAIAQLTLESIFIDNGCYRVDVEAKIDSVKITVATSEGDLLEEYVYENGDIIDDRQCGEA